MTPLAVGQVWRTRGGWLAEVERVDPRTGIARCVHSGPGRWLDSLQWHRPDGRLCDALVTPDSTPPDSSYDLMTLETAP